MAINTLVQQLCREEEVGFVDLCGCFFGRADMYMKDGLSGKGAAVFADDLSEAVESGMGKEATSTYKPVKNFRKTFLKLGINVYV